MQAYNNLFKLCFGYLLSNNAISNIHFIPQEVVNLLASTRQTKLKSDYKVPASIALGYAYDYRKGQVYVAAEYFLKVKEYNILTPRAEGFVRPDTGGSILLQRSCWKCGKGGKLFLI